MKAAIYCRLIRPDSYSECPLPEHHMQLIHLLEKEKLDLFAVYVDEMAPGQENTVSLHRCLQDLDAGLFQAMIIL